MKKSSVSIVCKTISCASLLLIATACSAVNSDSKTTETSFTNTFEISKKEKKKEKKSLFSLEGISASTALISASWKFWRLIKSRLCLLRRCSSRIMRASSWDGCPPKAIPIHAVTPTIINALHSLQKNSTRIQDFPKLPLNVQDG